MGFYQLNYNRGRIYQGNLILRNFILGVKSSSGFSQENISLKKYFCLFVFLKALSRKRFTNKNITIMSLFAVLIRQFEHIVEASLGKH